MGLEKAMCWGLGGSEGDSLQLRWCDKKGSRVLGLRRGPSYLVEYSSEVEGCDR